MQQRLTLTLDHNALELGSDDVILYRVSPSIDRPPLFEPGPGYEPRSPAWIAALVPASDGGTDAMWARAFSLTMDGRERIRLDERHRRMEEEKARAADLQVAKAAYLRGFVAKVTGTLMAPAGLPYTDLKQVVRAAGLRPGSWSTRRCLAVLDAWALRTVTAHLDSKDQTP